jgi:hypothetical protein
MITAPSSRQWHNDVNDRCRSVERWSPIAGTGSTLEGNSGDRFIGVG